VAAAAAAGLCRPLSTLHRPLAGRARRGSIVMRCLLLVSTAVNVSSGGLPGFRAFDAPRVCVGCTKCLASRFLHPVLFFFFFFRRKYGQEGESAR
ncbi:unnamed protein product, partial [Ixodes persulcatus]